MTGREAAINNTKHCSEVCGVSVLSAVWPGPVSLAARGSPSGAERQVAWTKSEGNGENSNNNKKEKPGRGGD